jgi:uncharacterized membrane protein
MTYQVSYTTLPDPRIRRTVLVHTILSYLFGVVIVAGSVNLIAGLVRLSTRAWRPAPAREWV